MRSPMMSKVVKLRSSRMLMGTPWVLPVRDGMVVVAAEVKTERRADTCFWKRGSWARRKEEEKAERKTRR